MNAAALLENAFIARGSIFAHRGTATLADSHDVGGTLVLASELAITGTSASVTGSGSVLDEGARVPSGLSLTIGGDTYTTTAEALVVDGALTLTITPAATTTYAAGASVVLADSVSWDLVALDAQVNASRESREPGSARVGVDHAATVHVLQTKLAGLTAERLRKMELTLDGRPVPVKDAVNEDPYWALIAGKGAAA